MDASNQPIWITGARGLIGNYLLQTAANFAPGQNVIGLTREQVDLMDYPAVRRLFQQQEPKLVVHCAGLSKSPACQANPGLAYKLNVEMTAQLAQLAAEIPFIFFSTDLVFDGAQGNYDESASVNPLNIYAETKVAAENIVLANPRHTVVRTSLNSGTSPTGDRSFNEEMRRAWQEGNTLNLFTDEFRSPIPAVVTALAVWELAAQNKPGLYHLAGSEKLSRWKIGELLAQRCPHLNPKIHPASLKDYQGAPRSPDTSLNCSKLQNLLGFPLPAFSKWLVEHRDEGF